jgi:hypothetical protein
VDLSHLPLTARPKATGPGLFYRLDYEIVLLFGLTELKAQVAWKEKQGIKVCRPHFYENMAILTIITFPCKRFACRMSKRGNKFAVNHIQSTHAILHF